MSDLKAVLNSDNTIKAVLSTNNNIKAVVNNGVTINNVIDGGQYIHFDVTQNGSNLQFSSELLSQYSSPNNINIMKNGVYLNPSLFEKISANTIQVNVGLTIGDTLDILATGSAQTGGGGIPGGGTSQVQYNNLGTFGGNPSFTFNQSTQTVSMVNANVSGNINLANVVANNISSNGNVSGVRLSITANANVGNLNTNNLLSTGSGNIQGNLQVTGNLSASNANVSQNLNVTNINSTGNLTTGGWANVSGNLVVSGNTSSTNITNTGNLVTGNLSVTNNFNVSSLSLTSLTTTNANLGNVSNIQIYGGTNGYVLQTDGTGNLSWTAQTGGGGGGNGTPGGSNTQIQFNDAGTFGGNSSLTFNKVASQLTVPKIQATIVAASSSQPNITSLGTLVNLTVSGNVTASIISGNHYGDGGNLTNIVAGNIVGTVANSNYSNISGQSANATFATSAGSANTAGSVTTNAQPNITSVGTLSNLNVTGTITTNTSNSTNVNTANLTVTNAITGNINGSAITASTVTASNQPNITSVGTLGNLTVSGNVSANRFNGTFVGSGINITSINASNIQGVVANATFSDTSGYANTAGQATIANSATIAGTVTSNAQPNITSVGSLTSLSTVSISTNNLLYANGSPWVFSTYGNGDVANYLPTYSGNLNNVNNLSATKATISSGSAKGLIEPVSYNSGAISTTQNIDVLTNTVYIFNTAGTANVTINVRGNSITTLNNVMNTNESITFNISMRNPTSPTTCVITSITVDGTTVGTGVTGWSGLRWFGTAPGSVNTGFDVYNITIIKVGSGQFIGFGARGSTT